MLLASLQQHRRGRCSFQVVLGCWQDCGNAAAGAASFKFTAS